MLASLFLIFILFVILAYSLMMLAFAAGFSGKRPHESSIRLNPPKVSVIIPCHNEEANIENLLGDIFNQGLKKSMYEVILVEDHSTDQTVSVAKAFAIHKPEMNLRILRLSDISPGESGKKAAITLGVNRSASDHIFCIDGDCRASDTWLSTMISGFDEPHTLMVLGPVSLVGGRGIFSIIQKLEFLGLVGTAAGSAGIGFPVLCNGANMAFNKKAFSDVRAYQGNEKYRSGDDMFLLQKIKQKYGRLSVRFVTDSEAMVCTPAKLKGLDFLSQRLRWVSKSRGIHDPMMVLSASLVYLVNALILVCLVLSLCQQKFLLWAFCLFMLKVLADLPLMMRVTRFSGRQDLMLFFPLAEIWNVFYVILVGSIGHFFGKEWK